MSWTSPTLQAVLVLVAVLGTQASRNSWHHHIDDTRTAEQYDTSSRTCPYPQPPDEVRQGA